MYPEHGIGKIGRYEILEEIGRGGMAIVYRGLDSELNREVAVKVLPEALAHDQQFVQRFRDEAVMAARLRHPNIVTIYDVGQVGNSYYIVMQYLHGANLDRVIEYNGALPPETAVGIASRVASALDAAHQRGIIHRDVKPSNIMISPEGDVTLMDFGLVRAAESSSHITRTGTVVGTPEYMSPEQAQGEPVDQRTDVYSLGLVVYKMFNGISPFSRSTPLATLLAQTKDPVPFSGPVMGRLPRDVRRVLERVLAKDPSNRYPSAGAFVADLVKATGAQPNRPIVVRVSPPPAMGVMPGQAAAAGAASAAATVYSQAAPPTTRQAGGVKGAAAGPPPPPYSPTSVGGGIAAQPAGAGKRTWLFALVPLLIVAFAAAGYFATRSGSRSADAPAVAPVATEKPTAASPEPAFEPTVTLAAVGPAPSAATETVAAPTSTPVVVEKTVVVVVTSTPLPAPSATASRAVTPVATASRAPTRGATATPQLKPTPAPAKATAVPSPRPQAARQAALPAPALIGPPDGVSASGPMRFEWTWSGPALNPNQGFEVRVWRQDQPEHYGAAAPVSETSATINVGGTYGVQQGGTGSYFWTVALVQRDPYVRLGPEAPPRTLLVTGGGGGGGPEPTQQW
jgi:hypothetical protein